MGIALQDDMFTPEVITDPYAYYGRLRDDDPVHWNEKYHELWVITAPRRSGLADPVSSASCFRPPSSRTTHARHIRQSTSF